MGLGFGLRLGSGLGSGLGLGSLEAYIHSLASQGAGSTCTG